MISTDEKTSEKKEVEASEIPKVKVVTVAQGGAEDEDLFGDFTVSDNHGVDQKNNKTAHDQIEIDHSKEETANQIIKTNNDNVIDDEDLFGYEDKNDGLNMNKQSEG